MTLSTLMLLSALQDAAAQDAAEAETAARLLSQTGAAASTHPAPAAPAVPWWMLSLGLLGAAGAGGMAYQNRRRSDGISSDVVVLSRTTVSRTSSLAVIEVSDAGGQVRRMLVGLGGGAPNLVADLSPTPSAADAAAAVALEDAWMAAGEEADAAEPAPAVADLEEDVSAAPRRRGVAAYAAAEEPAPARPRRRRKAAKSDLISAVLSEEPAARQEASAPPPRRRRSAREEETWQDPWARNFAAILGHPTAQRSK